MMVFAWLRKFWQAWRDAPDEDVIEPMWKHMDRFLGTEHPDK